MNDKIAEKVNNMIPIGSIVKLKGSKAKVMIISYLFEDNGDYSGVFWPIGDYDKNVKLVFGTADVEKIIFRGFENEEFLLMKKNVIDVLEKNSNQNQGGVVSNGTNGC